MTTFAQIGNRSMSAKQAVQSYHALVARRIAAESYNEFRICEDLKAAYPETAFPERMEAAVAMKATMIESLGEPEDVPQAELLAAGKRRDEALTLLYESLPQTGRDNLRKEAEQEALESGEENSREWECRGMHLLEASVA